VAPQGITWQLGDDIERINALFAGSGRLMLRVHCGHLVDEKGRALSSSVDALMGTKSPRLPAGVFEAWCFVAVPVVVGPVVNPAPVPGTVGLPVTRLSARPVATAVTKRLPRKR
jgi:hypothetical protein